MLTHYADSHKGLAFTFENTPGSKLAAKDHTLPVDYSDAKPVLTDEFINKITLSVAPGGRTTSTQQMSFDDPRFQAAIATKPTAWAYEKEWRYVEETHDLFPWPGPLREVTFGMKMPADRRSHYRALVAKSVPHPVAFSEIRASANNDALLKLPCTT